MKRAVIFDLGNTLVSYFTREQWPAIRERAIGEVAACLGQRGMLRVDAADLPARVAAERGVGDLPPDIAAKRSQGDVHRVRPLEGRLARIFDLSPQEMEGELAPELCRRFMKPIFATARRYDDALPTLAELRLRGVLTGILSNSPWGSPAELWREELARHELDTAVDAAVFCRDVGWRKPAPQGFAFIMDKLGVTAGECLFVGDDPRWDIAGPRAVGMDAVLIDRDGATGDAGAIRSLAELLDS